MIFVANYKMNGDKTFYKKVNKIFNKLKVKDTIVLCPPFLYMPFFKLKNKNVFLGSQDISADNNKKSTGQISTTMLKEFDVKYAIIGHSERREQGETDDLIAFKVNKAIKDGIVPIVCVGEKNKASKIDVLKEQVEIALSKTDAKEIIFAYEPVWAIGSGDTPSVAKINKAIKIIKNTAKDLGVKETVLYGGSVNLSNINEMRKTNAEGFLMGGVSLKLDEFIQIVKGE